MGENMATSVVKLVAILVVFLGGIIFTHVLCQIHTIGKTTYSPLIHSYYFPAVLSLWGVVLFLLSPLLGKLVGSERS